MVDTDASDDDAVIAYLAALEARRDPPESLPHPDRSGPSLAGAEMVHGQEGSPGRDEEAALASGLAAHAPGSEANVQSLEGAFVAAAAGYGRRHHVTYRGWIEAGVEPAVLERAGIAPDET
jgi:hypothetical protein